MFLESNEAKAHRHLLLLSNLTRVREVPIRLHGLE